MNVEIFCPISGKSNAQFMDVFSPCITSDSKVLVDQKVENFISKDSGLIFNAAGSRGDEAEFYAEEYNMRSEAHLANSSSLIRVFPEEFTDDIVEFISGSADFPEQGKVLDIGAGKGLLLNKFNKLFPSWEMFAIEPSKYAHQFFQTVLPNVKCFEGILRTLP